MIPFTFPLTLSPASWDLPFFLPSCPLLSSPETQGQARGGAARLPCSAPALPVHGDSVGALTILGSAVAPEHPHLLPRPCLLFVAFTWPLLPLDHGPVPSSPACPQSSSSCLRGGPQPHLRTSPARCGQQPSLTARLSPSGLGRGLIPLSARVQGAAPFFLPLSPPSSHL